MNNLVACGVDMTTCDVATQTGIFQNFFGLMASYIHGSTSYIPYLSLDRSPEANNLGYPDGEDGTIGKFILILI